MSRHQNFRISIVPDISLILTHSIVALIFCISSTIAQNISKTDSLLTLLHSVQDDSLRTKIYNDLSEETQYSIPEMSVYYARCALAIAQKAGHIKGIAISQNQIGNYYKEKNNFDSALISYRASLENFVKIDYEKGVAALHSNIGTIYYDQQNFETALHNFYMADSLFEKTGDKNGVAFAISNISMIFRMQGKWQDAVYNFKKALETNMESGNEYAAAVCLSNIGNIYEDRKFYDSALVFYQKALVIDKQAENQQGIATGLCYVGNIYLATGAIDSAKQYHMTALKIMDSLNDDRGVSLVLYNLGEVYRELSNPDEAISCFSKSLKLALNVNDMDILKSDYRGLSEAYKSKGNYQSAYDYLQLFAQINDSINSMISSKQLLELQTKYETQKKQQEIEIQQSIIEKRNYQIITIGSILILLTIIAILIIFQLRANSKKKASELQQKLLRTQMNPHFIFNALASIQGSVLEKSSSEASDYISKFASLMRFILESSKEEYIPLSAEIKILSHYLELQQLRYNRVFEFSIKILPDGEDLGGAFIPPMLAQPFIENAIEHGIVNTCSKGFIDVRFQRERNFIVFTVENYCLSTLYPNEDNNSSARPVKEVKTKTHKPLAMDITKERLYYLNKGQRKKIHFEFLIENNEEANTKISFYIPVTA